MTRDFRLVDGRAAFEDFNDAAGLRTSIRDAGSLVAANDNLKTGKNRKAAK